MNTIRPSLTLAVLLIAGAFGVIQQIELSRLKEAHRELAAKHRKLSADYAALLPMIGHKDGEIARLSSEHSELLKNPFENVMADQKKSAAVQTEDDASKKEPHDDLRGYLTADQLKFAGFDSPENTFQSWNWARAQSNYTNWLASLTPDRQEEELADPQSRKSFESERDPAARIKGMQVLARKPIGNGRVELKVRLDSESGVAVLVFPVVAVGNEWKLGDDIYGSSTFSVE